MEVEATALIEALKAQRNEALDHLAMARVVIEKLQAENECLRIAEKETDNA